MAEIEGQSWGVSGRGLIASDLLAQMAESEELAQRHGLLPRPDFVLGASGVYVPDYDQIEQGNGAMNERYRDHGNYEQVDLESWRDIEQPPDVLFIAMPSSPATGDSAYEQIRWMGESGGVAITAEKRSLALNFDDIMEVTDDGRRFGGNASFGGGTNMLEIAPKYLDDFQNVTQIHLVANGTMNDFMESIVRGMSEGQAVDSGINKGFADPLPENAPPSEVIRNESENDLAMKVHNFMRMTGLMEQFDWERLKMTLEDADLKRIVEESDTRRLIASIYPADGPIEPETDVIPNGGVDEILHGADGRDWRVVIGFRDVSRNKVLEPLAQMTEAGNGFVIGLGPNEKDGVYHLRGPGAGRGPTVRSMQDDLLRIQRNGQEFDRIYDSAILDAADQLERDGHLDAALSIRGMQRGVQVTRVA